MVRAIVGAFQAEFWLECASGYRDDVEDGAADDPIAQESLEELERSIVANIADDVQVGVVANRVEMVIRKDFAEQRG